MPGGARTLPTYQGQGRARPGRSAAAAPRQPGPAQTLPAQPSPAQPTCLPGYPPVDWQSGTVCRRHSWTNAFKPNWGYSHGSTGWDLKNPTEIKSEIKTYRGQVTQLLGKKVLS